MRLLQGKYNSLSGRWRSCRFSGMIFLAFFGFCLKPVSAEISSLRAAYNSDDNLFFLVWTDDRNSPEGLHCYRSPDCNPDIYGSLLNSSFSLGEDIALATERREQGYADIAYNPTRNEYLIVYQQLDEDFNIYAVRADADGQLLGTISVYQDPQDQWEPTVACDSVNDRYLITWMGYFPGAPSGDIGKDVKIQLLAGNGEKIGESKFVSVDDSGERALGWQERPVVVFVPEEGKYVLVWEDSGTDTTQAGIGGTVVDKDGAIVIDPKNFIFGRTPGRVFYAQIDYSSCTGHALVVWQENLEAKKPVKAQRIGLSGEIIGEEILLDPDGASGSEQFQNPRPGVACDGSNGSCLTGWYNWHAWAGKLQFIDRNGQKQGEEMEGLSWRPSITLNAQERYFLVVKSDNRSTHMTVDALPPDPACEALEGEEDEALEAAETMPEDGIESEYPQENVDVAEEYHDAASDRGEDNDTFYDGESGCSCALAR